MTSVASKIPSKSLSRLLFSLTRVTPLSRNLCTATKPSETQTQKLERIADELLSLSKLERYDYAILLRHKMGLNKYGPAISGMQSGSDSAGPATEEKKASEKVVFDVKLEKFDAAAKIKIIKEVRGFTDLGLKDAKDLVEKVPVVVKKGITKDEADSISEKLKALGATVLSQALSQPQFLCSLLTFHPHFLVSPLVAALSAFDDHPITKQLTDLIILLSNSADDSIYAEFVARVSDRLSSGALAWSRRQLFTLHCLGVLLDHQKNSACDNIKDKDSLVFNLVSGLQLPSEEIRGEILFVLYKILVLPNTFKADDGTGALIASCPKLLRLSLDVLMKTESDDVRMNAIALLSVLVQRGFFDSPYGTDISSGDPFEDDNFMEATDQPSDGLSEQRINHHVSPRK